MHLNVIFVYENKVTSACLHDSIVVSIPACHAGDRGSIPRRGVLFQLSPHVYKIRTACTAASSSTILAKFTFIHWWLVYFEYPKEVPKYILEF